MADKKLLGDMTTDVLKKLRADRAVRVFEKVTGTKCKCAERQEKINELHRKWRQARANYELQQQEKKGGTDND